MATSQSGLDTRAQCKELVQMRLRLANAATSETLVPLPLPNPCTELETISSSEVRKRVQEGKLQGGFRQVQNQGVGLRALVLRFSITESA